MASSPSPALREAVLSRIWAQWIALGVDAVGADDPGVVDPEALIAATAELGDMDARLRDASTDWCVAFGRYVNGSRLKQVVRELGTPADSIGEYVATVHAAGGPAWPMATGARPEYASRGKARMDSAMPLPRLRIRLRAAFGVNARADVLAALLSERGTGLSVSDLARRTRFTKPNVAFAVDALVLAGLVQARPVGNERRLLLAGKREILPGLQPGMVQHDWVTRFGVILRVLRFADQMDEMSTLVRAIEAKAVVQPLIEGIRRERLPLPELDVQGEAFAPAFDRWVVALSRDLEAIK